MPADNDIESAFSTPRRESPDISGLLHGLTQMATASLTDAVKVGFDSGLSLLTSGSPSDSPPHVLSDSAFHSLVAALQAEFDWVILDGPPVTAYPDAASLAAACGGAVLVLQASASRRDQ